MPFARSRQAAGSVAAVALLGVVLVAGTATPARAGDELRGSWAVDTTVGDARLGHILEITRQSDDGFSGALFGGGTRADVTGEIDGDEISFTSSPGPSADPSVETPGDTDWVGELSRDQGSLQMEGTFDPPTGGDGEFEARRVSSAVPVQAEDADGDGIADPPATVDPTDTTPTTIDPANPPLPSGGREIAPGQVPHVCAPGEGTSQTGATNGYYRSPVTGQWVPGPFCYARWGFAEMSPPQIAHAGEAVTVTVSGTDGSNSSTYAPQTGSITWTYPGTVESGCGNTDLTCTVIPTGTGAAEWQWFEFHVTMPRSFYIDSQGDLCAGQHLCAGNPTNAWSYVGIAPSPEAIKAATSTIPDGAAQPPFGDPTGDPFGSGGDDGGSTDLLATLAAITAILGVGSAMISAVHTFLGGGKGMGGKGLGSGAPGSAKGGGMTALDATTLLEQLNQQLTAAGAPPALTPETDVLEPEGDAPESDAPDTEPAPVE